MKHRGEKCQFAAGSSATQRRKAQLTLCRLAPLGPLIDQVQHSGEKLDCIDLQLAPVSTCILSMYLQSRLQCNTMEKSTACIASTCSSSQLCRLAPLVPLIAAHSIVSARLIIAVLPNPPIFHFLHHFVTFDRMTPWSLAGPAILCCLRLMSPTLKSSHPKPITNSWVINSPSCITTCKRLTFIRPVTNLGNLGMS